MATTSPPASRNTSSRALVPVTGCWVSHPERDGLLGIVSDSRIEGGAVEVKVRWGREGTVGWHPVAELRNGFQAGHIVQDSPKSNTRKTLGTGAVLGSRRIAGRDMAQVQLHNTGESRWFPYENLRRIKDASVKYANAEAPEPDSAERFRLKALAYALDSWNQVTGALDRLDVDPLPHQIDLVHRIMSSDQSNWLIADDVGLGKTIEVGLLLAAMKRRRRARRVLVVCPAGVARQWQDEMRYKFNEDFRIYGLDFQINQPSHWVTFDKVIVSIDRAKIDTHKPKFADSGDWDVVVFDEAHHLSKIENRSVTLRYQLADMLKSMTDSFIFLTGTPHQGRTGQFVNLLLLLRPDLAGRFSKLFSDSSVVSEVILRNRKSLVTDAGGRFIFKGQTTNKVEVPLSDSARAFDRQLQTYLKKGYAAADAGGTTGRAIGFVMTTYRKLASSSIAAIERSLVRRLARLRGEHGNADVPHGNSPSLAEMEEAFAEGLDSMDDLEEVSDNIAASNAGANPFFEEEQRQIVDLLASAKRVKRDDCKLKRFLSEIVEPVRERGERLLVFTEYRGTQDYVVDALKTHYPNSAVAQINGSMSLSEKRRNIDNFNETAHFMVSTEAGGEGINLQDRCHILVNYDLPWNPNRLVQRAGRLYRYGQKERVVVFNLAASDGFDNTTINMMLDRIETIARNMAQVSGEYSDGLETEIIGDLMERMDTAAILAANRDMNIERTDREIDNAISRAQEARRLQESLFAHVDGYDPQAATALYSFGQEDVLSFLEGILPLRGIPIRNRFHNGRTLEIELPEDMRGRYSEFRTRATFELVTVDRQLASRRQNVVPMDFASPFFRDLIEFAKSPEFKGEYASIAGPWSGALALYKIRWQNDQGVPRWDALTPIFLEDGRERAIANPDFFGSLLRGKAVSANRDDSKPPGVRRAALKLMKARTEAELAGRCSEFRHPNDVALLATADIAYSGGFPPPP